MCCFAEIYETAASALVRTMQGHASRVGALDWANNAYLTSGRYVMVRCAGHDLGAYCNTPSLSITQQRQSRSAS